MKPLTENLLRPPQYDELKKEKEEIDYKLHGPWKHLVQKPGRLLQRSKEVDKQLAQQLPEPITNPLEKNQLYATEKALREKITHGMLSQEEMRKNPAGAVDRHRRWERANKPDIMKWKNVRLQLAADQGDPSTWDRDTANLEQFRPEGATGRVRLDAQIPGKMGFTDVPQDKWDAAFQGKGPENTALKQAKRARKPLTDEQRAKLYERLAKARAARAQKKQVAMQAANEEPKSIIDKARELIGV